MSADTPATGQLFKAIAAAQAEMGPLIKDADNTGFRGARYASLAAVIDVVIPAFSKQGIAVIQSVEGDATSGVSIRTILGHTSGVSMEFISPPIKPAKPDGHGIGSAATYGRRYALMGLAGVAPEDDDGNAASGLGDAKPQPVQSRKDSRDLFAKLEPMVRAAPDNHELEALYRAHADEIGANAFKADILRMFKDRRDDLTAANPEQKEAA